MLLVKLVFLVPMISLLIKVLLVVLAINSATLLASPSIKEFRVIGACPEELCINNSTNKFFAEGDLCVPEHFKECTGCDRAACNFHVLSNSLDGHLLDFLLIFNFFGLLWLIGFTEVIFGNIVANFASRWQEEGGKRMSFGETVTLLISSCKKVLQTVAKAAFPCLPLPFSTEVPTSSGEEDGSMDNEDRSWWTWWWCPNSPSTLVQPNIEDEREVRGATCLIILVAMLVSTLLASMISFTIFAHTRGSSLAMELSHRWLFVLSLFTCSISAISSFSSTLLTFASLTINVEHEEGPLELASTERS